MDRQVGQGQVRKVKKRQVRQVGKGQKATCHEGADDHVGHLGQLVVQQGCCSMVSYLATTQPIRKLNIQSS